MSTTRSRRKRKLTVKNITTGLEVPALTTAGFISTSFLVTFLRNLWNKTAGGGTTAGLSGIVQDYGIPAVIAVAGIFAPDWVSFGPNGKYSKALFTGASSYAAFLIFKQAVGKELLAGHRGMGALVTQREPIAGRALIPRVNLSGTRRLSGVKARSV